MISLSPTLIAVLVVGVAIAFRFRHRLFLMIDLAICRLVLTMWVTKLRAPASQNKQRELVGIKSDEIVFTPVKDFFMPFMSFDYAAMCVPLDYSYYFGYRLDTNAMKQALQNVLKRIPVLGGSVVQRDSRTCGIDFRDPSIEFFVGECDAEDPIWEPKQSNDPLFHHNFCYQTDKDWPVPHNTKLIRITVTHFRSGRSLLSLGCSHALFDGIGLMTFLDCWTKELRGEEWETPNWDRRPLIREGDSLIPQKELPERLLGVKTSWLICESFWMTHLQIPRRKWTLRRWHFTPDAVNLYKEQIKRGEFAEKFTRLSTNDVFVALFWKLRALLARDYLGTDMINIYFPVNYRGWFADEIGKDYIGNGVMFAELSMPRRELVDADMSVAAWKAREMMGGLDRDQFEGELSVLQHTVNRGDEYWHGKIFPLGGDVVFDKDIMFSNCTKLPSLKADFGEGTPIQTKFNQNLAAFHQSYAFSEPDKRIEYRCNVPEDDLPFYERCDITDPSQVDWDRLKDEWYQEPTKSAVVNRNIREIP